MKNGRFIGEVEITDGYIASLVADQAPHYAALEVGLYYFNVPELLTVRLGDTHAIRFYRDARDAQRDEESLTYLRAHARQWTFPGQVPVIAGTPGHGAPCAWEIVPWLHGSTAVRSPFTAHGFANFGRALQQVHQTSPPHAPDNPKTSASLATLTGTFESALEDFSAASQPAHTTLQLGSARSIWASAVSDATAVTPTWTHGLFDPRFVISDRGEFAGIVSWKDYGAGDPAFDLACAALIAGAEHIESLLNVYDPRLDDSTVTRARGLLLLSALKHGQSSDTQLANLATMRLRELHVLT